MAPKQSLDARGMKQIHPIVFMFLYLPFGIFYGYISVTIGFLLTKAGISLATVATVVSIPFLPNMLKFLWAPLADTTLTVKKWYHIANFLTAAGILAISILPLRPGFMGVLFIIVLITSLANTMIAMTTENLLAQDTSDDLKGRAGGWLQAGSLGGVGLGGGVALWLAGNLSSHWISGAVIAIICLLCGIGLFFINEPKPVFREKAYIKTIQSLLKDVWSLMKSPIGFLALLLCFVPIGSGAASNLWSAVSGDWKASAGVVALVIGIFGGILSAVGAVAGGWICDRMDRKQAYILFGLLQGLGALAMALSPHTQLMFIIWTSVYAITSGMIYAGFSAFAFEAIGKKAAATKYNILAALSNLPKYLMIFADEWAHTKWSATGMLLIETGMAVLGATVFISIAALVNRKSKPAKQIV